MEQAKTMASFPYKQMYGCIDLTWRLFGRREYLKLFTD